MTAKPVSDEILNTVMKVWLEFDQNCASGARYMGISRSTFVSRLDAARIRWPERFEEIKNSFRSPRNWTYPQMLQKDIENGVFIIGNDAHIWPGEPSMMMKAFTKVARQLKVTGIILNGDIIDGAKVSRHGAVLGVKAPKVTEEIEAAKDWIRTFPKTKYQFWTVGNHDIRVDNYLANSAPELGEEYAGLLSDRFPDWEFCWAVQLNDVEIRHRFRGGIHAAWNNSLHSGLTIVTGHTHQLQITAVRDRNGSRWGVEAGMLADANHKAFQYTEGAPSRANAGFVVLTFKDGILLPPEFCENINGRPTFRGEYVF